MIKIITLEIGNSSWWKNKKYRKEASIELRKLRKKYKSVRVLKKYRLKTSNTIIYGDYALKNQLLWLVYLDSFIKISPIPEINSSSLVVFLTLHCSPTTGWLFIAKRSLLMQLVGLCKKPITIFPSTANT